MKIILHDSIFNEILDGDINAIRLIEQRQTIDLQLYILDEFINKARDLSDSCKLTQNNIPPLVLAIMTNPNVYFTIISKDQYQEKLEMARTEIKSNMDISYIAAALLINADGIWTHDPITIYSSLLPISLPIYTTSDLIRSQPQWKILPIEALEKESQQENQNNSDTETYDHYGSLENFDWLRDDRHDPMFYQRFLHFYGLLCLNDDKIYYLDPEQKGQLSLPKLSEIKPGTQLWWIQKLDTGYDDYNSPDHVFLFEMMKINGKWDYYWQIFLHKEGEEFFKKSNLFEKKKSGGNKYYKLEISPEWDIPSVSSSEKPSIPEYTHGSDIFTTDLDFTEFHLPKSYWERDISNGEKFLGINRKKIDEKDNVALKIGNQVFSIAVPYGLCYDWGQVVFTADNWKRWNNRFNFYFLKDNSQ